MVRSVNRPEYPYVLQCLADSRQSAGLTQIELAAKMGRTQAWVSSVQRGYRRMDLVQVADWVAACGLSMEEFGAMIDAALVKWKEESRRVG